MAKKEKVGKQPVTTEGEASVIEALEREEERRLRETLEDDTDKCEGPCGGRGFGVEFTEGDCPEDCAGHVFKKETIKRAKINARADANGKCQNTGGPDCLCTGGTYVEGKTECEPITIQNRKLCKWFIKYTYRGGTCKEVK
jgi:hypothetical protein